MAKKTEQVNVDPLAPARTRVEWEVQGWSSKADEMTVAQLLEVTFAVRFDPDDALFLREAARLNGTTRPEFVRRATLQEARKTIAEQKR